MSNVRRMTNKAKRARARKIRDRKARKERGYYYNRKKVEGNDEYDPEMEGYGHSDRWWNKGR